MNKNRIFGNQISNLDLMTRLFIVIIGFVLFNSEFIGAQETPPIRNFTTNEYEAENQNWSISQGKDNYIYVANNAGLLEYNGAKWNLYPSPNDTFFRAVKVIGDKIYTGCFREFGFWERNEFGKLIYQSLIVDLREPLHEDEHIWNILSFDKWIFTVASNLFRDYLRRHYRQKRLLAGKAALILQDESVSRREPEIFDTLRVALEKLEPEAAELITLRYYGQLSFKELAEMRDEPIGTTLSKVHRGIKKLRLIMEEL